ncbi:MAG: hypothetical protein S4CHLAM102_00810 [Chlamydiia bacterium]|nr:hypothetical protein [Chlamydiia bacterium]
MTTQWQPWQPGQPVPPTYPAQDGSPQMHYGWVLASDGNYYPAVPVPQPPNHNTEQSSAFHPPHQNGREPRGWRHSPGVDRSSRGYRAMQGASTIVTTYPLGVSPGHAPTAIPPERVTPPPRRRVPQPLVILNQDGSPVGLGSAGCGTSEKSLLEQLPDQRAEHDPGQGPENDPEQGPGQWPAQGTERGPERCPDQGHGLGADRFPDLVQGQMTKQISEQMVQLHIHDNGEGGAPPDSFGSPEAFSLFSSSQYGGSPLSKSSRAGSSPAYSAYGSGEEEPADQSGMAYNPFSGGIWSASAQDVQNAVRELRSLERLTGLGHGWKSGVSISAIMRGEGSNEEKVRRVIDCCNEARSCRDGMNEVMLLTAHCILVPGEAGLASCLFTHLAMFHNAPLAQRVLHELLLNDFPIGENEIRIFQMIALFNQSIDLTEQINSVIQARELLFRCSTSLLNLQGRQEFLAHVCDDANHLRPIVMRESSEKIHFNLGAGNLQQVVHSLGSINLERINTARLQSVLAAVSALEEANILVPTDDGEISAFDWFWRGISLEALLRAPDAPRRFVLLSSICVSLDKKNAAAELLVCARTEYMREVHAIDEAKGLALAGENERAYYILEHLVKSHPTRMRVGLLYEAIGKGVEAKTTFTMRASDSGREGVTGYTALIRHHYLHGELREASQVRRQAVRTYGRCSQFQALHLLGAAKLNDPVHFRGILTHEETVANESGWLLCERGRAHMVPNLVTSDISKAKELFLRSIMLYPNYGDSYLELYRVLSLEAGPHEAYKQVHVLVAFNRPTKGAVWKMFYQTPFDTSTLVFQRGCAVADGVALERLAMGEDEMNEMRILDLMSAVGVTAIHTQDEVGRLLSPDHWKRSLLFSSESI